jgi:hypothetical protein
LANLALDQAGVPKFETHSGGAGARNNPRTGEKSSRAPQPISVRAHYVKGVLVPVEPLDLPEGAEVAFELRVPPK